MKELCNFISQEKEIVYEVNNPVILLHHLIQLVGCNFHLTSPAAPRAKDSREPDVHGVQASRGLHYLKDSVI